MIFEIQTLKLHNIQNYLILNNIFQISLRKKIRFRRHSLVKIVMQYKFTLLHFRNKYIYREF